MAVIRDELRTGLLVVFTTTVLALVLIYLEVPGLSGQRHLFRVYFDNANGINVGSPVMLAGRKVGQVSRIDSPIPESERPRPNLEVAIEVAVYPHAMIYREEHVMMLQYNLLAEQVIDFSRGNEASGLAPNNASFVGERQLGLSEVGQKMMEKLDPVIDSATVAIKGIQGTAENLKRMTQDGSDLVVALAQFRQFSAQLAALTGTDGVIQHTINNLQCLSCKEGPLARALANAERFTGQLAGNKDIGASLRNFRQASESLSTTAQSLKQGVRSARPGIDQTVHNAEQFTDTVKRQPWRLIWPSTKQYPDDPPKLPAVCGPPRR